LGYFAWGCKCSSGLFWKPGPCAPRKTPAAIPPPLGVGMPTVSFWSILPTRLVILRFPDSGWWSFPRSAKKLLRGSGVLGHATGTGVAGGAGGVLDYTGLGIALGLALGIWLKCAKLTRKFLDTYNQFAELSLLCAYILLHYILLSGF